MREKVVQPFKPSSPSSLPSSSFTFIWSVFSRLLSLIIYKCRALCNQSLGGERTRNPVNHTLLKCEAHWHKNENDAFLSTLARALSLSFSRVRLLHIFCVSCFSNGTLCNCVTMPHAYNFPIHLKIAFCCWRRKLSAILPGLNIGIEPAHWTTATRQVHNTHTHNFAKRTLLLLLLWPFFHSLALSFFANIQ